MQQADHWTQALGKAREWLNKLSPQDQVALVTFIAVCSACRSLARMPRAASGIAQWRCEHWRVDRQRTLGRALVEGVSLLNEASKAAEKRLVVIGDDFRRALRSRPCAALPRPESVSLTTEPVTVKQTDDLAASLVAQAADQDDDAGIEGR